MSEGFFGPIKKIEMEEYSDLIPCLLGTTRTIRQALESCEVIGYDLFSWTTATFLIKKESERESEIRIFCVTIFEITY